MNTIKLYFHYVSLHIRTAMQYKSSFWMVTVGQTLNLLSALAAVWLLMDRFGQVEGYSAEEIFFCFGLVNLAFGLAEFFFRGFDTFSRIVRQGEFDRILVRPRNEIFQVLTSKMDVSRSWSKLVEGTIVIVVSLAFCGIAWDPLRIAGVIFLVLGGMAYFAGLFLIYAAFCFFTLEGLEFMNVFTDGGREFGAYPLAIYGKGMLTAFTFVLPMACFQYYPFLYLSGRSDNPWLLLTPLACFAFLLPCYAFWRFGVRKYKSSGS